MKKLPPYGAPLAKFIATGKVPATDIYLFCGLSAWSKSAEWHKRRFCLCLPPFLDPAIFQWPVKNCDVLLFETGDIDTRGIEEIAYHLLLAGAKIVRAVNNDFDTAYYRRTLKEAA